MGRIEEAIGGSWLNRIGVALLVIGIAFALGYSLTVLGPGGKAALATGVSVLLLVLGVFLERKEAYQYYGRGLIAGGWAALYATAYAVHELTATRIIESPVVGFALLLLVGLGMIGHSLRYANQGLTALAYGLAYAAIVLHSISAFTLAAAALLGLGTVLHLLRRTWYGVALGGMLATYGSLLVWYLRQETLTADVLHLGIGALAIDWLVFLTLDFSRQAEEEGNRLRARYLACLNATLAASLAFVAWNRVSPAGTWQVFGALGTAYVVTSVALRRWGRLTVHPVHSVIASLGVALAAREGMGRTAASWTYLAEAQGVFVIGTYLKDRFHRMLGCTLFLIPMVAIVVDQAGARVDRPEGAFDLGMFLLTAAACLCLYGTYARLRAFLDSGREDGPEFVVRTALCYAPFLLVLVAIWVQLPSVWFAPAAALLMLVLLETGIALRNRDFGIQAYLTILCLIPTALMVSAPSKAQVFGMAARVPALLVTAAAFYALFLRRRKAQWVVFDEERSLVPAFTWVGTGLAALVIWLQARVEVVGPVWMILGVLLVEVGLALRERHLRQPGYAVVLASQISLALSNMTATGLVAGLSVRAATVVPSLLATYYLWWRLRSLPSGTAEEAGEPADEGFGRLLSYTGGALAALFVRFEFGLAGAALRWSLAMMGLLVVGYLLRDADFRIQAYLLAGAVLVRAVGFDFRSGDPILGMDGPLLITLVATACYLGAGFLVRLRQAAGGPKDRRSLDLESRLAQRGQDLMWLLALVLVALYLYRSRSGFVLIVAWAIEGLCATAAGFAFRTRPMRLSGLGLLGRTLAMTLYRAFTTFDTVGRIISFLVLGVVLLIISFGYARYRESLRKAS